MTYEAGYTIRVMAARCRMSAYTLRYYERVGLIHGVERSRNGHRRYSDADEAWLKFLQFLRATHMPIREIRRFARFRLSGDSGFREQKKILEEHRGSLEKQITRLKDAMVLLATQIEVLQSGERENAQTPLRYSQREESQPHARRGKLLDFEPSRTLAAVSETEL